MNSLKSKSDKEFSMTERTLIMLKPDTVRRQLMGEVIARIERKGLGIVAMKMIRFDRALADKFYQEHVAKNFYPELSGFITSGPVVAMAVEGENAIKVMRQMMGATNYINAEAGTIRGDLAFTLTENVVHGSDGPESAAREIGLIFSDEEICA
jgi:nucleoside-diphosphate kinase